MLRLYGIIIDNDISDNNEIINSDNNDNNEIIPYEEDQAQKNS